MRRSGSPLLTTVKRDALFAWPSLQRQQCGRSFRSRTDSLPANRSGRGIPQCCCTGSSRNRRPTRPTPREKRMKDDSCSLCRSRSFIHLSVLFTTDLRIFLDWQWMDGRLCFKGQTDHWSSLGSLGWLAAATQLVGNGTHGSKFQPHTAAGYQDAKPDRSSFRASLGSVWGECQVVN